MKDYWYVIAVPALFVAIFALGQIFNIYQEPGHKLLQDGDVINVGPEASTNYLWVECIDYPSTVTNITVRLRP